MGSKGHQNGGDLRFMPPGKLPTHSPLALGIDPGLSGSIALVSKDWVYWLLDLANTLPKDTGVKMDSASPGVKKRARLVNGSYLSPGELVGHFRQFTMAGSSRWKPGIIVIEDVAAQTGKESASSSFKFGQTKGLISGIVHSLFPHVPVKYLKPAVWKPNLGLGRDKKQSLSAAKRVWSGQDFLFSRVKDADRAEAALLGLCGLKLTGAVKTDIR